MTIDPRMARRRRAVAEQRARTSLRRLIIVLVATSIVALGVWVFRTPLLAIDSVDISGTDRASLEPLLVDAGVVAGNPLISVDPGDLESRIEQRPEVVDAAVSRRWPGTITIEVQKRTPIAWIGSGPGPSPHVAVDGVIVERAVPPAHGPFVRTTVGVDGAPGTAIDDRATLGALEFIDALRADLRSGAVIEIVGSEINATVAGYPVRVGLATDMRAKARALAAVIDQRPDEGSEITVVSPERPAVLPPSATTTTTTTTTTGDQAEP